MGSVISGREERATPSRAITRRSAATTASGQFVAKMVVAVVALASTAVVTHALSTSDYAAWGTALTISGMVAFLLDPGLTPAVVRRLASDQEDVPSPALILKLRLLLAAVSFMIVVGVTTGLRGVAALPIAAVLAAELFSRAGVLTAATWLQSEHRLHRQTGLEALFVAFGLGAGVVMWQLHAGPELLAVAVIVGPSVLLALGSVRLARAMRSFGRTAAASGPVLRSLLREVAPLAGALALVSTYTRIDVVFVSAATDARGLASYVLAFRFIDQIAVAAGVVAGALFPLLAARFAQPGVREDRAVGEGLVVVTAVGAMAGAGLIVLAHPLIDLIAPPRLEPAGGLLVLLAPTAAALFMNFYVGYLLMSMRRAGRYLWLNAAGLALNLLGNAVLTLAHGPPAAARLTWATEWVVAVAAAYPVLAANPGGNGAMLVAVASVGAVVAASEAAWAGAPGWLCGGGALLVIAALGRQQLLATARSIVSPQAVAGERLS